MKTIEELVEDYYVDNGIDQEDYCIGCSLQETYNRAIREAYIAGAKAAQVWISVEDELPKWGEIILVKINNEDDMLSTARHQGNGHFAVDCQELYRYNVTHWRPIEYK